MNKCRLMYLPLPEQSWTAITGEGGETAVVGQGVDKVDVPVSKPVEAEYDEVMASSTDGLPFRKSLQRGNRRGQVLHLHLGIKPGIYHLRLFISRLHSIKSDQTTPTKP